MWLYLVNTLPLSPAEALELAQAGVSRLILLALCVAAAVLLCDKMFAGKKWW